MKKILDKWNSISLILRILCGIILAIIVYVVSDVLLHHQIGWIGILGTIFVSALKAIAPVLVFILVCTSLCNAKGNLGSRFTRVICLYLGTTLIAAAVSVIASKLFPVSMILTDAATGYDPVQNLGEVIQNLLTNIVMNPVKALAEGNYLGILFWAIVFGLILKSFASENTKNVLSDFSEATSRAVKFVIGFAPFGVFGILYSTLSETGFVVFKSYGSLILLLVGCMLFTAFVTNPLVVFLSTGKNPYPLVFRCIRESAVTAFFTRSSAANIPVNMQLCKNMGLDPDFYSVSIPLGSTINMDGAAVTITIMSLATANTLGIEVGIGTAILLSIISTLGACGTSGVAGGSILLIPMACSLLGIGQDISMQVVAVGFIIGVIQDSVETALNSSSDVIFTATAEMAEKRKQERLAKKNNK